MLRLLEAAWLLLLVACTSVRAGCPLSPSSEQTSAQRLPGDGGYRILLSGDYDKYIPNAVYTVSLQGPSDGDENDRPREFKRFTLSVDSQHAPFNPAARVGYFQIFPDSLTEFNEECVNTVSEISDYPKSEVQVMWRAPAAGSGCVVFTAMVLESPSRWYAEDGHLSRTFCEMSAKETESLDELRCCACDEAKYKMVLEGIWSNETHPKDFPRSVWLTHLSDVVGASHETNFSFWGRDHVATDGFRQFAEWGSVDALEAEMKIKAKYLRSYIKAPGLWYPNVNTNTSADFKVDRKHPLLSVASALGPSPDWVVGVSKLNLCQRDCTWIRGMTIDLYPWDAGTDNGITYMSANSETRPRERMKPITTMYPEDPRSPFYDPSGKPMLPVARLYLDREAITKRSCDDDREDDLVIDLGQFDAAAAQNAEERPECATTAYSDWSGCSANCGKGTRTRKRAYRQPEKAALANCNVQLVSREACLAPAGECSSSSDSTSSGINNENDNNNEDLCETSDWNDWSRCSASCGSGFRTRQRRLRNPANARRCHHVELVQKERCVGLACNEDENVAEVEKEEVCKVTEWSDWSQCSVTCGKGVKTRTRALLVAPNLRIECARKLELVQHRPCLDQADCTFDKATAKVACLEKTERGPCRGYFEHWAFNAEKRACVPFVYGGCRGNKNNFRTLEDCQKTCDVIKESLVDGQPASQSLEHVSRHSYVDRQNLRASSRASSSSSDSIDCQLSDWSAWSPCSVTCGTGFVVSTRHVINQSANSGRQCPRRRLQKRARCQAGPCER